MAGIARPSLGCEREGKERERAINTITWVRLSHLQGQMFSGSAQGAKSFLITSAGRSAKNPQIDLCKNLWRCCPISRVCKCTCVG